MSEIRDASFWYVPPLDRPDIAAAPLAARAALLHSHPTGRPLLDSELPEGELDETARAFIADSSWRARCPTDGCGAEIFVSCADPRLLCPICQRGYFPVEFPDDADKIEAVLSIRPAPQTRNWLLHETLADLKSENVERLS